MPWISQMLGFAVLLLGIAFALWVSFWLLLVIFIIGIAVVVWTHVREFLVAKGILTPRFSSPRDDSMAENEPSILTIDGDYKRVDSE
jgi:hypothetical protein